jgi:3-oxoacyl-[acyl-carrier protein] reductase
MDQFRLTGAVAIVTGAGAGLGRAEALALAGAGARVVLNDLPGDAVHAVAEEVRAGGGEAVVCTGDVGDWSTGQALLSTALDTYGTLEIVVNNAGLVRDRMVFSMSADEWDLVLRVHLRGHFITTRFATQYWRDQSKATGKPVYARIVNTSSEAFLLGSPGQPNYAAAKAGIVALTVSTARGCARYGVRANAICPQARTAMTATVLGPPPTGEVDPLSPAAVAPLVTYLASPAAADITGEVFVVRGDVAAVLAPPTVRASFRAEDGPLWSVAALHDAFGPLLGHDPARAGFANEDTLTLTDSPVDGR